MLNNSSNNDELTLIFNSSSPIVPEISLEDTRYEKFPEDFKIGNYLHHLDPSPKQEKNKYICPVCKEHNLSIAPDGLKYDCYNCGDKSGIARWCFNQLHPLPNKDYSKFKLGILTNVKPVETKEEGTRSFGDQKWTQVVRRVYHYENSQVIVRDDGIRPDGTKGKRIFHAHINAQGNLDDQKREEKKPFLPYGVNDWKKIPGCAVVVVEGEKCADIGRSELEVALTTIRHSKAEMESLFVCAKALGISLIYWRDNDKAGEEHQKLFLEIAEMFPEVPAICLDPAKLFDGLDFNKGDDIEQWIERGKEKGLDFIERLEREIHRAIDEQKLRSKKKEVKTEHSQNTDPEDEFRINIENPSKSTPEIVVLNSLFGGGSGNWKSWNSSFYKYSGLGYWKSVTDHDVETTITEILPKLYSIETKNIGNDVIRKTVYGRASHHVLQNSIKYAEKALNIKNWQDKNEYIVFNNCTLDLRTGEQLEHSREHFTTNYIESNFTSNQPCPEVFQKFVEDSYGIEYLEIIRAFTASFLDSSEHYPFFPHLLGRSGSGKGVMARFWTGMFPESSVRTGNKFDMISSPDKRHQNLTGVRLFNFADMAGYHKNLGDFYELVDNGRLAGRALFDSAGYEKRWNIHFIMSSVYTLQIENASEGWDRRAIPITTKDRTSKNDPHLESKLKEVVGEVISWALAMPKEERYLTLLEARNNPRVAEKRRETDILSDSTRHFIDRCLRPSDNNNDTVTASGLYQDYVLFCKEHGSSPLQQRNFVGKFNNALSKFHVPRKSVRNGDKVTKAPDYFKNTKVLPGTLIQDGLGRKCVYNACEDGGLQLFEEFSQEPKPKEEIEEIVKTEANNTTEIVKFIEIPDIGRYRVLEERESEYECVRENGKRVIKRKQEDTLRLPCLDSEEEERAFYPPINSWVFIRVFSLISGKYTGETKTVKVLEIENNGFRYRDEAQNEGFHHKEWKELSKNERIEKGLT